MDSKLNNQISYTNYYIQEFYSPLWILDTNMCSENRETTGVCSQKNKQPNNLLNHLDSGV